MNTTMTTPIQTMRWASVMTVMAQGRCQASFVEQTEAQIACACRMDEGAKGDKKPISSVPIISGPGGCGLI